MKAAQKLTPISYKTDIFVEWCPGCGDFGILAALRAALADLNLPPNKVAMFTGIGCSGRIAHYMKLYGIHVLHGRPLPFAIGAKLANPELTVLAVSGDGDGLGIGAGHFVNAGRRNVDVTYLLFDNRVYGLTKGQASPTLPLNVKTKALPKPNINDAVNPIALAITSGFTFAARGYAFQINYLKELIVKAIEHRGLSLVQILQPCPTYNDIHTKDWYEAGRIYRLEDEGYDPVVRDPAERDSKKVEAILRSMEDDRIPIGVFYKDATTPPYDERIRARIPSYPERPPAAQEIAGEDGLPVVDLNALLQRYRVR